MVSNPCDTPPSRSRSAVVRREVTPQPQLWVAQFRAQHEKGWKSRCINGTKQSDSIDPAQNKPLEEQPKSFKWRTSNEAKHLQHSNSLPVPSLVEQDHDSLPSSSVPEAEAPEAETAEGWMMERTPNLASPRGLHQKAEYLETHRRRALKSSGQLHPSESFDPACCLESESYAATRCQDADSTLFVRSFGWTF